MLGLTRRVQKRTRIAITGDGPGSLRGSGVIFGGSAPPRHSNQGLSGTRPSAYSFPHSLLSIFSHACARTSTRCGQLLAGGVISGAGRLALLGRDVLRGTGQPGRGQRRAGIRWASLPATGAGANGRRDRHGTFSVASHAKPAGSLVLIY